MREQQPRGRVDELFFEGIARKVGPVRVKKMPGRAERARA